MTTESKAQDGLEWPMNRTTEDSYIIIRLIPSTHEMEQKQHFCPARVKEGWQTCDIRRGSADRSI